jgi:PRTRC genetic system protein A
MGIKGFFWKWTDFLETDIAKPINIVAGSDGLLYEIRENKHLRVVTACPKVRELEDVAEGVKFKLPKIPGGLLVQTIEFFKHFAKYEMEALVYVTWNKSTKEYELHCPEQRVGVVTVEVDYPSYDQDRGIVVVMHSHHNMNAYFSSVDDRNDQALCVYGVFGKLDLPQIEQKFRAGFNGRHYDVNVTDIFNFRDVTTLDPFPTEWIERVHQI